MELNLALVTQFCSFCLPNFVSPSISILFFINHARVGNDEDTQTVLFAVCCSSDSVER